MTAVKESFGTRWFARAWLKNSLNQSYLKGEVSDGTPVVFVDRAPVGVVADAVVTDNAAGAGRAVAHPLVQHDEEVGLRAVDLPVGVEQLAEQAAGQDGQAVTVGPGVDGGDRQAQACGSPCICQDMDAEKITVLAQARREDGVELRLFDEPRSAWKALAAHRNPITGRASCGPWRGAR